MKKIITLFFAILATFAYGQYNVPLTNANVESTNPMASNGQIHSIDGMFVQEAVDGSFDEANSGLATGEGVGGSQAFKIVTQNNGSTLSWHTQFAVNQTDISGYGNADFSFSFQIKSASAPTTYPIWIVVRAFDEDQVNVSANTLVNYANGGKISASVGDPTNSYLTMNTGYQTAWITFSIAQNNSGKNAKFIDVRVQMAKEVNTYYIDNLSLQSSAPLSTKSFEAINVKMYPNPTNSSTFIKSDSSIENITIYSLSGKLIMNENLNSNEYRLNTSSFAKGVYFLGITNSKGKSYTKLIVK